MEPRGTNRVSRSLGAWSLHELPTFPFAEGLGRLVVLQIQAGGAIEKVPLVASARVFSRNSNTLASFMCGCHVVRAVTCVLAARPTDSTNRRAGLYWLLGTLR
eukprot:2224263-Amphidinium_carterae.1